MFLYRRAVLTAIWSSLKTHCQNCEDQRLRPGKVPLNVVRRRIWCGHLSGSGEWNHSRHCVRSNSTKNQCVGMPNIKSWKQRWRFSVWSNCWSLSRSGSERLLPTWKLNARLQKSTTKMLDTMIETKSNALDETRAWRKRHASDFDFEGTVDGEIWGGSATERQTRFKVQVVWFLASKTVSLSAWRKAEESLMLLPEDYQAENLAGKAAQFKITVNLLKNKTSRNWCWILENLWFWLKKKAWTN